MNDNPIPPSSTTLGSRELLLGVACFTALCGHHTLDLMSTQLNPMENEMVQNAVHKSRARWAHAEIISLLQFLLTMRPRLGDASSFPASVYEAAAAHIMQQFPSKPKIGANVEYKWGEVRFLMVVVPISPISSIYCII